MHWCWWACCSWPAAWSSARWVLTQDELSRLPGLTQVQVRPRAGLTFPAALRSVLRQDPDVIMVGEMRDRETVEVGLAAVAARSP